MFTQPHRGVHVAPKGAHGLPESKQQANCASVPHTTVYRRIALAGSLDSIMSVTACDGAQILSFAVGIINRFGGPDRLTSTMNLESRDNG